ncbi:Lrp/AsnC family transcriptional regulator [Micromonospora sp. NBC_01796]|uniref:Lrp/AsnC family transcriptional regulator n=1 Tax=Micromonospora sp. NBC_01796 TaxID=2975987 RepID=UPI002DDB4D2C|nr:Lrp/AsnC family transcriptional regulator [Micromonospora sp. NBC_01796]WSA89188.1 Lrp/AsnC family transcriptional regulator [Micromonospora sp. NBC_01796]
MASGPYDLDPTDRRIVAALQVNGRASWTEIAALIGTSVTTVARRAQQLIAGGLVKVAVAPQPGGGPVDLLIVRVRCTPGSQLPTARALAARPEVRFVAVLTGAHDLVAELLVPRGTSMHSVLSAVQRIPGVQATIADLLLHTYKSDHEWSRRLLGDDGRPPTPPVHDCPPDHLDEVDERIVAALRHDGRTSFHAVALGLGISESTVRRRFEALHGAGCVQVITLVPAAALGFEAELLFWLSVTPARLEAVAHELAALTGVRYVAATLGQESLMCEVILPTHADVLEFTTRTLARIDGVRSWSAGVELLTVKRGFVLTPWTAGRPGTGPTARTTPGTATDAAAEEALPRPRGVRGGRRTPRVPARRS